jgi:hypothetical protein
VSRPTQRFPRAKLFALAAELQSSLEYWIEKTEQTQRAMDDAGVATYTLDKMRRRYDFLDTARANAAAARANLYDCP